MKYTLLNPAYGYLNEDAEFKSFNIEDAAFYTNESVADFDLEADIDNGTFIKTDFTEEQINDMPFDIPDASAQKEIDLSGIDDQGQSL